LISVPVPNIPISSPNHRIDRLCLLCVVVLLPRVPA
jgi:hypothetical protein